MLIPGLPGQSTYNIPLIWSEAALQAIRAAQPATTVIARALAIVHTCMYDAWSAYDHIAMSTSLGIQLRRPLAEHTTLNKEVAISYAAYRSLLDLFPDALDRFRALMLQLGYDPDDQAINTVTPAGIGNLVAHVILKERHHDGANQLGDLHPGAYSDYTGYRPKNSPDHLNDPDQWQPLKLSRPHYRCVVQQFTTPHWSSVTPFALQAGSQFRPFLMPARAGSLQYSQQANELLDFSANLTDDRKAMVEYWQAGPHVEQLPGLWCLIAHYVIRRDIYTLDRAVKLCFILSNALLDASIACWDTKRTYNAARPLTAIHHLYQGRKVQSWAGPYQGTRLIDGECWHPYQSIDVPTPSSPEYCAEHSCLSAAAASTLTLFTGSDYFGGTCVRPAGSSLIEPGKVPATDITLSWPTFADAVNEAGLACRYAGLHFEQSDLVGRALGQAIGSIVWYQAQKYIQATHEAYYQRHQ
jgi:hypothetical protein